MKAKLVSAVAVVAALGAVAASPAAASSGYDLFETDPKQTSFNFQQGASEIPADFFGPGSQPFTGQVQFGGNPLETFGGHDTGDADTIVQRTDPNVPGTPGENAQVPIEIVALNLVSVQPITVQVGNGSTQLWDVSVTLSPGQQSTGFMQINRTSAQGGTFGSSFDVFPLFTFTNRQSGEQKTLDMGQNVQPATAAALRFNAQDVPWVNDCAPPALLVPGLNDGFCPSLTATGLKHLTVEQALLATHGIVPAQPRLEHFQCYEVRGATTKKRNLALQDQFGASKARLGKVAELCNPARKNNEPWVHKKIHQVCYGIKDGGTQTPQVWVRNQFGSSLLQVKKARWLCAPSTKQIVTKRKRKPNVKAPNELLVDHFKCYPVKNLDGRKGGNVTVRDQFGKGRVRLAAPDRLCNPVQKNQTKSNHPIRHLVCYPSKGKVKRRTVRVRNQFGRSYLKVVKRKRFCVPSTKLPVLLKSGLRPAGAQ